jgi:predicted RNA-binding Zn ribbon-like protein
MDPRFPLFGGRPCLNLTATLGRRHAEPVERIPDDEALVDWLVAAEVLPPAACVTVPPGRLHQARELRETVYRLVVATMTGLPFARADVARVNAVAARPDLAPQLRAGRRVTSWGDRDPVDAALASLARDAVDLVTGRRTSRIRECERADCSLLFFDDSQSGRRRWCSMDRCGNLVKIAGYRRRARA